MARTRSVLIDNTLGRIFRNLSSVNTATAANLIAGAKIESLSITAKTTRTTVRAANNIGTGKGIYFPGGGLIILVTLSLSTAAAGLPVIVRMRAGNDYASSTEISLFEISTIKIVNYPVSITVPAGQSIFYDIVQSGSIKAGVGLSVRSSFYKG